MDKNNLMKDVPKNLYKMQTKKEKLNHELAELEIKEKNVIKKLMEDTLKKKRDNEAILKSVEESLNCFIKKLDQRKAQNDVLTKKINEKRSNSLMMDVQDGKEVQNNAEITKRIMEKIQEQTEIVEKQTIVLERLQRSKESTKSFCIKINNLKAEIKNKQNELSSALNVYTDLSKICQELNQRNVSKSLMCKNMDEKAAELQSKVDSINNDVKKLTN